MGEERKDTGVRAMQEYVGGMKNARGVSEVISVVLLLAVVVVGVGIIAVTIYSQPTPAEIPEVSILVSNTSDGINLIHNGGDSLPEGTFYVLADGVRLGDPVSPPGGVWPWSLGEVLRYDVKAVPEEVRVVYTGAGGEVLLKSATFSGAAGTAGPDVPAETEGGGGMFASPNFSTQEGLDDWVVEQFANQLKDNSIYLSQTIKSSGSTAWVYGGSFEFTLSDSIAYLKLGTGNMITFAEGDTLKIELKSGPNCAMQFFAIGHGGWHISATDVTITKNGSSLGDGDIVGGRIYDYKNFTSSVVIETSSSNYVQTEFYVNDRQIINGSSNHPIILTNIRPADPTLMILDISKNDPCYFVGDAEIDSATLALINASMSG